METTTADPRCVFHGHGAINGGEALAIFRARSKPQGPAVPERGQGDPHPQPKQQACTGTQATERNLLHPQDLRPPHRRTSTGTSKTKRARSAATPSRTRTGTSTTTPPRTATEDQQARPGTPTTTPPTTATIEKQRTKPLNSDRTTLGMTRPKKLRL